VPELVEALFDDVDEAPDELVPVAPEVAAAPVVPVAPVPVAVGICAEVPEPPEEEPMTCEALAVAGISLARSTPSATDAAAAATATERDTRRTRRTAQFRRCALCRLSWPVMAIPPAPW
jgi:hypothetical protein